MGGTVLMQRGMKDKRYKKTEDKMFAVFFDEPNCTMRQLAKKAGVGHSTAYLHHHSVRQIISDYENYVLTEYQRILKKDSEIRKVYFDTLIFILKNQKFFELFLKFNDKNILMEMLLYLEPKFCDSKKIFRIYMAEVIEIIFDWEREGFPENKVNNVLSDIVYLTDTVYERLGPIR